MPDVGVIGSLVWDEIHGRDPLGTVVQEWGGIAYALASLDAGLPEDWRIVPLIKVGRDLAQNAREFLGSLRRLAPGARCVEVPDANNRVVLTYQTTDRRCERMSGGVPGWTWSELGPMVRDLDALYLNFISGYELSLGTAQALRQGFRGMIYADFHSLLLGVGGDGMRMLQPLPDAPSWFGCFDVIQVNEDEMNQMSPDPLSLAAAILGAGARGLIVTLGPRGAVYFVEGDRLPTRRDAETSRRPITTALIPAEPVSEPLDPTGCGDVFGGAAFSRLLAGESLEQAVIAGNHAAARNVRFRGASGLANHLRGELVMP
jgi:hypothetical protein